MTDTILFVDDEPDLLTGITRFVKAALNCRILTAENGDQAIALIRREPVDLVVTDIRMPGKDGLTLLGEILAIDPHISVMVMSGFGTIETAVAAIREGAYDFIQKPFSADTLIHAVRKALERNRLVRENLRLSRMVCETIPGMIGTTPPMQTAFDTIRMLAKTDVTVLIRGETGTGKEMAARAIHESGKRRSAPMITVNCPALPESILESELFGYRKGAFTGATKDRTGHFDAAEGGTIFLDEIGDLSMAVQTKLLRVLQEREIQPLGSNTTHKIDVRIIAATHQNLEEKIKNNTFRADLFYRLNIANLVMPPLREMPGDIPVFVEHFLKKSACLLDIPPKHLSPLLLEDFLGRTWPGNVRELENTIHGLCAMTQDAEIPPQASPKPEGSVPLPPAREASPNLDIPYKDLKEEMVARFTRSYLDHLFTHTKGNVSQAAKLSGIQRQSLQKIIRRYDLSMAPYRKDPR